MAIAKEIRPQNIRNGVTAVYYYKKDFKKSMTDATAHKAVRVM